MAAEFGDTVDYRLLRTQDRAVFAEWGSSDDLLVDGKSTLWGPPLTREQVRKKIARKVARLGAEGARREVVVASDRVAVGVLSPSTRGSRGPL